MCVWEQRKACYRILKMKKNVLTNLFFFYCSADITSIKTHQRLAAAGKWGDRKPQDKQGKESFYPHLTHNQALLLCRKSDPGVMTVICTAPQITLIHTGMQQKENRLQKRQIQIGTISHQCLLKKPERVMCQQPAGGAVGAGGEAAGIAGDVSGSTWDVFVSP